MNLNDILREFGNQTGLDGLSLDENNMCRLIFNGEMVVDIELLSDGKTFFMYATVGKVPPTKEGELYKELLKANLFGRETGGASFGLYEEKGEILLHRRFDCDSTDYDTFCSALESFVGALEHWRNRLSSWEPGDTQKGQGFNTTGAIRA